MKKTSGSGRGSPKGSKSPIVKGGISGYSGTFVVRNREGQFVVKGTNQASLIKQHPDVKIKASKIEPKHLSKSDVAAIVRSMKVA
jgi:hypothetical protein